MTIDETAQESTYSKKASGSLVGFIIFLALVLGGIQYVSTQLISYYAQTQVCDRYARAKTDELESLVTQYKDCLVEIKR